MQSYVILIYLHIHLREHVTSTFPFPYTGIFMCAYSTHRVNI